MMDNRIPNEKLEALIEQLSLRGIPGTDDPTEEAYNDTFDALIELHAYRAAAPLEKVREWAEAEREGRLKVLPCKVGDTIYKIDTDPSMEDSDIKSIVVENFLVCKNGDVLIKSDSWDGVICKAENLVNKTPYLDYYLCFTTREEATAALEGREGQG